MVRRGKFNNFDYYAFTILFINALIQFSSDMNLIVIFYIYLDILENKTLDMIT